MAEPNPNPTTRDDVKQGKGNGEGDKQGKGKGKVEGEGEGSFNPSLHHQGEGDKQGKGKGKVEGEGEGSFNPSRHEHKLLLFEDLPVYTCSGCKESGANTGYKCQQCKKLTLHSVCAVLPDDIQHPFGSNRNLKFRSETIMVHRCSACRERLRGFVFETENRDIRLHPLCMVLPKILDYSGHANHELKILTGDLKDKAYKCNPCGHSIRGGWRYRCAACKFYVHPGCAKNDMFGLPEEGIHSTTGGKRKTTAAFFKSIFKGAAAAIISTITSGAVSELFQGESSEEQ